MSERPTVFLIPGLGYDHRIFSRLNLTGFDLQYVDWIEVRKGESLPEYAQRMAEPIKNFPGRRILIGHSFGGVLAQEMAHLIRVDQIILISSVKSRSELSYGFRSLAAFGIHYLFHKSWVLPSIHLWGKSHGFRTPALKVLFQEMVGGHSNYTLSWKLGQLSRWRDRPLPPQTNLFHFHGDDDRTLSSKLIQEPFTLIPKGNHIMILDQADLMSKLINETLKSGSA